MECLRCKKEFIPIRRNQKFCSSNCRNRYNMRILWLKKKDDPEYRKRKNETTRLWYQKNKKKHKEYMKYYMREYYRKNYSKETKNEKT